jgi:hypothetical protein
VTAAAAPRRFRHAINGLDVGAGGSALAGGTHTTPWRGRAGAGCPTCSCASAQRIARKDPRVGTGSGWSSTRNRAMTPGTGRETPQRALARLAQRRSAMRRLAGRGTDANFARHVQSRTAADRGSRQNDYGPSVGLESMVEQVPAVGGEAEPVSSRRGVARGGG